MRRDEKIYVQRAKGLRKQVSYCKSYEPKLCTQKPLTAYQFLRILATVSLEYSVFTYLKSFNIKIHCFIRSTE